MIGSSSQQQVSHIPTLVTHISDSYHNSIKICIFWVRINIVNLYLSNFQYIFLVKIGTWKKWESSSSLKFEINTVKDTVNYIIG